MLRHSKKIINSNMYVVIGSNNPFGLTKNDIRKSKIDLIFTS
jgi:hypothetical protein